MIYNKEGVFGRCDVILEIKWQGVWCGTHAGTLFLVSHRGIPIGGRGLPLGYSGWEIGVYGQTAIFWGCSFSLIFCDRERDIKEDEELSKKTAMQKRKRIQALLLSLIMVVSLVALDFRAAAGETVFAAEDIEETVAPTIPQNVREEDGFIVWDEDENAYGYMVQASKGEDTWTYDYYENSVEWSRFIYERSSERKFGEYTFKVCAFDETRKNTGFSEPITVIYASTPSLSAPTNLRRDDDNAYITWNSVEGAVRYNIRVYQDDDNKFYKFEHMTGCSYWFEWFCGGNYRFEVQAMDRDYHVSEWTKPLLITHTVKPAEPAKPRLDTPKNVRLDKSGENILWNEVENADYYEVSDSYGLWIRCEQPILENWKRYSSPWSDGRQVFQVGAFSSDSGMDASWSDALSIDHEPICDKSITVPTVKAENGYLKWDAVENAKRYAICILVNGKPVSNEFQVYDDNTYEGSVRYHIGNRLPEGSYEVELYVIDDQGKYNCETYPLTLDTAHDEDVWVISKIYHKFSALLWDYDRLRHENTCYFWIRLKKGNDVVKLVKNWDEFFYGLPDLSNGEYSVDACVYEYNDKLGQWSNPLEISKHGDGLFDKENESTAEVETPPEGTDIPEDDRVTSITINPAFNMKHKDGDDVEIDLTQIKIKAKEIYDEEGLKRAEEALGEEIVGNKHYNLLDLTLLYKGEDFSNGYEGLVQVIIPIPKGHRDKTFSCYRLTEVDGEMTKELIPGEQTEDSYIIYLEHFSEYALVGAGEEEHTHVYSWNSNASIHWKECTCGGKKEETAHTEDRGTVTKEPTKTETGLRTYKCSVCGCVTRTEDIAKLDAGEPGTQKPNEKLSPVSKEERQKNKFEISKKISAGWKGNSLTVAWSKLKGASGYDLYAAVCGDDYNGVTLSVQGNSKTSAKIKKVDGKNISKTITYKVKVRAYRLVNGKKQYIGTSHVMHVAGSKNKKITNAKAIKLAKSSYTIKKGQNRTIKAIIVKDDKNKKLLSESHGPKLRYTSSDESIATVTESGKIKAKKKGTCTIYVRALNGISKKIKVIVN